MQSRAISWNSKLPIDWFLNSVSAWKPPRTTSRAPPVHEAKSRRGRAPAVDGQGIGAQAEVDAGGPTRCRSRSRPRSVATRRRHSARSGRDGRFSAPSKVEATAIGVRDALEASPAPLRLSWRSFLSRLFAVGLFQAGGAPVVERNAEWRRVGPGRHCLCGRNTEENSCNGNAPSLILPSRRMS